MDLSRMGGQSVSSRLAESERSERRAQVAFVCLTLSR